MDLDSDDLFANDKWLFSSSSSKIKIVRSHQTIDNNRVSKIILESTAALVDLQAVRENSVELFVVVRQNHTWSRLQVNEAVFQHIIRQLTPYSHFWDLVRAFGYRTDDDTRTVHGFRWRYDPKIPEEEFGYNIRFFQRNYRSKARPWSLRQTGVYQRFDQKTLVSTWVLLQPSAELLEVIERCLGSSARSRDHPVTRSLRIHAAIIAHLIQTWLGYTDYIYWEMDKLREKAYSSQVGAPTKTDYSVRFLDCQQIERLRADAIRARGVIDSSIETVRGCLLRLHKLTADFSVDPKATPQNTFEMQAHQVKTNEYLVKLQGQAAKDSRLLKLLSIMATLYLPASLVLSFFGSNLVQAIEGSYKGQMWNIVLVQQAWLAIVIPAPLIQGTLVFIVWVGRQRS
ncbi:hypothetical protein F5X98DRAFT_380828 [Xylaria grammica]|nr:hypothetical protein F5X98DRAFT_380828 [Xylaria grammica]